MLQALLAQLAVPLTVLQAEPQAPQFVAVILRSVSQPLVSTPSQLPKFVAQTIVQAPAVQPAVPLVELHTVAHVPQCVGSICSAVSQPLVTLPSQFA